MRHALANLLSSGIRSLTGMGPVEYAEYVRKPGAERSRAHWGLIAWLWGMSGWLFMMGTAAAIGFIGYAVYLQAISLIHAAYLILLCTLLAASLMLFLAAIAQEGRISIESNWGGLGGGLGGWRVSSSLTFLCSTAALFALLVMAVSAEPAAPDLRERYRAAISAGAKAGLTFDKRGMMGGKFYLKGKGPQSAINEFWNQVKLANPLYDDIWADLTPTAAPAGKAQ